MSIYTPSILEIAKDFTDDSPILDNSAGNRTESKELILDIEETLIQNKNMF